MIGFLSGLDWLLPVFLPSFVFVQTGFVAVILFLFMRNDMNFTSTGHSFEPVLMASTGFFRVVFNGFVVVHRFFLDIM